MLSSEKVPDLALQIVWNTIMNMLSARPDIHHNMVVNDAKFTVIASAELLTDLPQYRDIYDEIPGTDWNQLARGLGSTMRRPFTSAAEENILCYDDDKYHRVSSRVLKNGAG